MERKYAVGKFSNNAVPDFEQKFWQIDGFGDCDSTNGRICISLFTSVFISRDRPTVHTNPLIRKRSSSKTFFKPEESEDARFSFYCGRKKTFWTRSFSKTMTSRLASRYFHLTQNDRWLFLSKNTWCVFKVKPPFSIFFRRCEGGLADTNFFKRLSAQSNQKKTD